ncbi:ATP-binding cassette domain-containing protein [Patescibacteria group bacterium]|nr:ATP-binding cassette domain-containing protein [Patescibacteria group bacterium]
MENEYLILDNLYKIYNPATAGEVTALDHMSLSLKRGEFVTIVGSNAAGKSSLFNAIAGSLELTSGKIILDGARIDHLDEHVRAAYVSRVRQNPNESTVPSMTLAENLAMAKARVVGAGLGKGVRKEWRPEFEALLKPLGIGLEKRLETEMSLFSGGQKQSVALLMATMIKPKLLLLDEHTAALDPRVSEQILRMTDNEVRKHNITTLMITHNIHHAIKYGDRLIMLERGRVVFEASGEGKKKLTIAGVVEKLEAKVADFEEEMIAR